MWNAYHVSPNTMWLSTLEWTTAGAVTVAKTSCMLPIIGVSLVVSVTKLLVVVTYLDPKVNVVSRFGRGLDTLKA